MTNPDVILRPFLKGTDTKWEMEVVGGGKGGPGNYPTITVPRGTTDKHLMFKIENPQGSTWTFAKDSAALWVTDQGSDPTGPSTSTQVPVTSIKTKNGDTELHFKDLNSKPNAHSLNYTLNFVNGAQKSSTLDPIIQNDGCCQIQESFWSETQALAGNTTFDIWLGLAFLAGVAATIALRRLRGR